MSEYKSRKRMVQKGNRQQTVEGASDRIGTLTQLPLPVPVSSPFRAAQADDSTERAKVFAVVTAIAKHPFELIVARRKN